MLKRYSVLRDLSQNGALAQLGERLLCTQEVRSSNLLGSIGNEVTKTCSLKTR